METITRKEPNILMTGTPGVGKTRLSKALAEKFTFNHYDVSKIANDNDFVEGYDDELKCPIIDEDGILDHLEPLMTDGGNILDYHSCDFFPERWIDVIFVVRCDNTILFDRLTDRNYDELKIENNIQAEIFQTILDEAKQSYDPEIVHEIRGDRLSDFEENIQNISSWIEKWREDNK